MKFCMCVCLWHLMIPRLFGLDQIRAERVAFNKPVVQNGVQNQTVRLIFMKYCLNMCLLHKIIPIVFATDLMRAERMPFQ